jgi:hypothetical protein
MEQECPICLCEIEKDKLFITNCCKKQFHLNCFNECMKYNPECPLCRKKSDNVVITIQENEEGNIRYNIIIYQFISFLFLIATLYYLHPLFIK